MARTGTTLSFVLRKKLVDTKILSLFPVARSEGIVNEDDSDIFWPLLDPLFHCFQIPVGTRHFPLSPKMSRSALCPTQPYIYLIPMFFPRNKAAGA
jgi:hypothetical protein